MRAERQIPGAGPPEPLMQMILRMTLADSAPSFKVVLQGILASSSLRLSGNRRIQTQGNAISALARSLSLDKTRELTSETAVASMVLYLYNSLCLVPSETTHSEWISLVDFPPQPDGSLIGFRPLWRQEDGQIGLHRAKPPLVYGSRIILQFVALP